MRMGLFFNKKHLNQKHFYSSWSKKIESFKREGKKLNTKKLNLDFLKIFLLMLTRTVYLGFDLCLSCGNLLAQGRSKSLAKHFFIYLGKEDIDREVNKRAKERRINKVKCNWSEVSTGLLLDWICFKYKSDRYAEYKEFGQAYLVFSLGPCETAKFSLRFYQND